ncbi:hypothetical protein ACFWYA_05985 [Streptomyces sp. NPDC059011]|uniref:hypothetical protein n=1 Tax=unclassified Streptomyces TaxID=2593676 RepID=UPI0036A79AB5
MSPPELDLRLDGFGAADEQTEEAFWHAIDGEQDSLIPLAEHHTADGTHSFYVLHNRAATWGIPGEPQLVALHLRRDLQAKTFRFDHAALPLPAMAQSWLIHRGCPQGAIGLLPGAGPPPADVTTRVLEQRLMGDGYRYAMGYSYTRDDPDDMVTVVALRADDMVTVVALRALDERAPSLFRVVVEEVDTDAWTHTLREGGFATVRAALQWCEDRLTGEAGPLPPVRLAAAATRPAGLPKAPAPPPSGRSR